MLIGRGSPEPGKIIIPDNRIPVAPAMADTGSDGVFHSPPVGIAETAGNVGIELFGKTLAVVLGVADNGGDEVPVACSVYGEIQFPQHASDADSLI